MKIISIIIVMTVVFYLTAFASLISTITGRVRFRWNYTEMASTNLAFNVYCTSDLAIPASQWPLLTNILSTDALDTNDVSGTNFLADFNLPPSRYFFVCTASNFWGESSITSNVVSTPNAPRLINTLKIQKM